MINWWFVYSHAYGHSFCIDTSAFRLLSAMLLVAEPTFKPIGSAHCATTSKTATLSNFHGCFMLLQGMQDVMEIIVTIEVHMQLTSMPMISDEF